MFWKHATLTISLFLFAAGAHAATFTWDGGGGDPFWSTGANWVGDVAPGAGDDLIFPGGALQLTNNNDLAVTFNSITFTASGYLLQGAAINVANGVVTTHGSGTSRIHSQLVTATSQTFSVASGGTLRISTGVNNSGLLTLAGAGTYVIDGVLSGTGSIERTAGLTFLQNNNPFTGAFTISGGVVQADDPIGGGVATGTIGVVLTGAAAELRGSGEVGDVLGNQGRVMGGPLLSDPTLTTGDVTLSFLSTYNVRFLSPTITSSLDVNGTVLLDNPALDLELVVPPAAGAQLVIIDNDGADAVNGTFLGLPEGATFTDDGQTFRITYVGGDGNDVVLTVTEANVGITKVVDDPTPAVGQNVTFTISVSNAGPTSASDVTVVDMLPAGLTYVSATPSQGTCGAPTVTCTLGTINAGANATVTLVATVTQSGVIVNTASVTTSDEDPNGVNNSASVTINAAPAAPEVAIPTLDPRALVALAVLLVVAGALVLRH